MNHITKLWTGPQTRSRNIKKSSQEKHINFITFTLDLLALMVAYQISLPIAGFLIESFQTSSLEMFQETAQMRQIVYFCLSLSLLFFLFLQSHYSKRMPWWSQLHHIAKIFIFALMVDLFANVALELYYSRILIVTNWVVAFGAIIITRYGVNIIKSRSENWQLPAVIIADTETATNALYALASDRGMGLTPRSLLLSEQKDLSQIDREEFPASYRNIEIRDRTKDWESYIRKHPDHFYMVSLENISPAQRENLIRLFRKENIEFSIIPAITHTSIYQSEPRYFFGNDVMLLNPRQETGAPLGRALKRLIDIVGALIALSIFLIPMLLVALFLKLEGQGGSPLYAGKRVGRNGKLFKCWKFRTMEPGTDHLLDEYLANNPEAKAHWERYFKLPDDPRVQAKTARFIRKASIDELPQLWNVLKGDMSLVGPRPILESEIEAYGDKFDEYRSVKPGITGLWQASGRNGTSFQRRVVWDSWYVRNWTLWGDVVIILKTVQVVLNRSGAS